MPSFLFASIPPCHLQTVLQPLQPSIRPAQLIDHPTPVLEPLVSQDAADITDEHRKDQDAENSATMSTTTATLIPLAQTLGPTTSALLAGLIGAMSYVSIPALAPLPSTLAAQVWKRTYDIGIATAPPLAVGCCVCFGFLAGTGTCHGRRGR